jgi:hypothetical protein
VDASTVLNSTVVDPKSSIKIVKILDWFVVNVRGAVGKGGFLVRSEMVCRKGEGQGFPEPLSEARN